MRGLIVRIEPDAQSTTYNREITSKVTAQSATNLSDKQKEHSKTNLRLDHRLGHLLKHTDAS